MDQMQRLRDVAISDSGFLFDPYTGLTFSVNATGRFILEKLKSGLDAEAIPEALRQGFELTEGDDPGRDVREFLLLLRENGILPREERT
jgi:hypothetical protein